MLFKILVILFLLSILFSLGTGLYHLLKNRSHSNAVVKALSFRIGLSVVLFILIMLCYSFGWVTPHPTPL